ncbi:hypothetical protein HYPSUDRAFT_357989 [Hypholoma sublateritium FD-334 SS-4]|uniref:Uncharacterized protein n=1 Tax=Hypholoma sublateritium (strain FD-334 SS-4) TaxID=945553 RepID=A0A0D2NGF1_HYPSF|nr:hypothetical protein HYPSUDRAFT_357989 [Hypholoma sublateritium FD-334 SS-4]
MQHPRVCSREHEGRQRRRFRHAPAGPERGDIGGRPRTGAPRVGKQVRSTQTQRAGHPLTARIRSRRGENTARGADARQASSTAAEARSAPRPDAHLQKTAGQAEHCRLGAQAGASQRHHTTAGPRTIYISKRRRALYVEARSQRAGWMHGNRPPFGCAVADSVILQRTSKWRRLGAGSTAWDLINVAQPERVRVGCWRPAAVCAKPMSARAVYADGACPREWGAV